MEDEWLTPQITARRCKCSVQTLRRLRRRAASRVERGADERFRIQEFRASDAPNAGILLSWADVRRVLGLFAGAARGHGQHQASGYK